MAEVIWTEPALSDLEAIADYIALDNPKAAAELVQKVYQRIGQLATHPESGRYLPDLDNARYREIIEPPLRVIYRHEQQTVYVVHVVRSERLLRAPNLGR